MRLRFLLRREPVAAFILSHGDEHVVLLDANRLDLVDDVPIHTLLIVGRVDASQQDLDEDDVRSVGIRKCLRVDEFAWFVEPEDLEEVVSRHLEAVDEALMDGGAEVGLTGSERGVEVNTY